MELYPEANFLNERNAVLLSLEAGLGLQGYAFTGVLWERQKNRKIVFAELFNVAFPKY